MGRELGRLLPETALGCLASLTWRPTAPWLELERATEQVGHQGFIPRLLGVPPELKVGRSSPVFIHGDLLGKGIWAINMETGRHPPVRRRVILRAQRDGSWDTWRLRIQFALFDSRYMYAALPAKTMPTAETGRRVRRPESGSTASKRV